MAGATQPPPARDLVEAEHGGRCPGGFLSIEHWTSSRWLKKICTIGSWDRRRLIGS